MWSTYETSRVDPNFICHHLNVNTSVTPKKQPPRYSFRDHFDAVKDEMTKFKQVGTIKEVFYPKWLANTVVRNGNGSGSGRVFSYPDPTRETRPVTRTRPV